MAQNRFERRRKRLSIVVIIAVIAVLATIAGWGAIASSSPTGAARVPASSR